MSLYLYVKQMRWVKCQTRTTLQGLEHSLSARLCDQTLQSKMQSHKSARICDLSDMYATVYSICKYPLPGRVDAARTRDALHGSSSAVGNGLV